MKFLLFVSVTLQQFSPEIMNQLNQFYGSIDVGNVVVPTQGNTILLPEGSTKRIFQDEEPILVDSTRELTQEEAKRQADLKGSATLQAQINQFVDPLGTFSKFQFNQDLKVPEQELDLSSLLQKSPEEIKNYLQNLQEQKQQKEIFIKHPNYIPKKEEKLVDQPQTYRFNDLQPKN